LIAAYARHQVISLRDGTKNVFDAQTLRDLWKSERRAHADEAAENREDHFAAASD
jgi:hypothetical protein